MNASHSRTVLNGALIAVLSAPAGNNVAMRQHRDGGSFVLPGTSRRAVIIAREGDFFTRTDPDYRFMHGSPWPYDVSIPIMFVGPMVKAGNYSDRAVQQDVAPTIAAALGVRMPPTSSGRVLPVLRSGSPRPHAAMLIVLDGMRRDYFDHYAKLMPTLTALRRSGAWFSQASVNVIPSNTAVGHSTIATGADPVRIPGPTCLTSCTAVTPDFSRQSPQDRWLQRCRACGSSRPAVAPSSWRREASIARPLRSPGTEPA
jgi:hypothetical protein